MTPPRPAARGRSASLRAISFAALFAAALGVPHPSPAQPSPPGKPAAIVVVSDDNYPPYVFRDSTGALRGILPEQWALWEKKTGVKVDLRAMDWAEAQRVMREGRADVIDTVFRTPERETLYDFTSPYAQIRVPVYQHRDLGGIADFDSLRGFAVGVKAGDAVVDLLASRGIHTLEEFPSYEAIVLAAKNDGLKVFSIDEPAAVHFLYKHSVADLFRSSFILYTGEFHRAVHKGNADLLRLVQNGFDKISSREYDAIQQKWLGSPVSWHVVLRRFVPLLLLVAAAFLLLLAANLFFRRQARLRTAELRQSRARLENVFRLAPVGICIVNRRSIVEANDLFCNTLGLPPDKVVGQSTRLIYASDDDHERYGREFYAQIARQGFVSLEIQTRNARREPLVVLVNGAPLDPANPDAGTIFTALDISERKKSEEALLQSQQYFSTLYNSMTDAVFIDDAETGQIIDVNQRMVEMYGFSSREDAIAAGLAPLCSGVPPYSLAEAAEWVRKARESGPQTFPWHARRKDGSLFWAEVSIRPFQIGSSNRLLVTARDVTDRKAAEEERLLYERRIQETQKLESLGLLAGGIAHDFNNLLTAILGNIDLALLDVPKESSARADLNTAIAATRRAAELAQQMLAYSGKGHFLVEPLDLAAEIRSTTSILNASISRNTSLRLEIPPALPSVVADASQFRQILMNLVINASEALENQPGSVQVAAGVVDSSSLDPSRLRPRGPLDPGRYVFVEVSDSGAGIRPEFVDKIFDPFFSTKFTGRGLGLPAVLGIVRGHKGAIEIDSHLGRGTRFRVYLPATADAPPSADQPPDASPAPAPGGLVLLVDDENSLLETSSRLLARLGHQVLCASGGDQALQLFRPRAKQVAAVILDLSMPGMDGVQTLAELRKIRPDVPVLASSGYAEAEVLQRFGPDKPDGFLQKPYTLEILRNALRRLFPRA